MVGYYAAQVLLICFYVFSGHVMPVLHPVKASIKMLGHVEDNVLFSEVFTQVYKFFDVKYLTVICIFIPFHSQLSNLTGKYISFPSFTVSFTGKTVSIHTTSKYLWKWSIKQLT